MDRREPDGKENFQRLRSEQREHGIEADGGELRKMMAWLGDQD